MTKLMDIVTGCENYLGWQPTNPRQPLWQARSVEIAKLQRAIDSGTPTRATTAENLALALEYSRRRRMPVSSPLGLAHRIAEALALANTPPVTCDIADAITTAMNWEREHDDPDSLRWLHRLSRCSGPGRVEILIEWQAAGRG